MYAELNKDDIYVSEVSEAFMATSIWSSDDEDFEDIECENVLVFGEEESNVFILCDVDMSKKVLREIAEKGYVDVTYMQEYTIGSPDCGDIERINSILEKGLYTRDTYENTDTPEDAIHNILDGGSNFWEQ
jgi:hypothetical protein